MLMSAHRRRMAADARVGQRLGSIELLGIIGRGGRATVYRGYCIVSRRAVAVKVMHPRFDIRRLESEYRALCQLDDPHIVRAYSYGYDPPHYVMELVEGETLAEYLRKRGGRLTEIEAIDIVRQLCQGLAAVHRVGVIHRDVTMSNVMIDHGRVVLIDLGMAKRLPRFREILGSVTPPSLRVVTTGGMGTLGYAAPEVKAGKPPPTPKADVYSIGCVLHTLITGQVYDPAEELDPSISEGVAMLLAGATDIADRRYDLHSLMLALEECAAEYAPLLEASEAIELPTAPAPTAKPSRPWPLLGICAALTLGNIAYAFYQTTDQVPSASPQPEQSAPLQSAPGTFLTSTSATLARHGTAGRRATIQLSGWVSRVVAELPELPPLPTSAAKKPAQVGKRTRQVKAQRRALHKKLSTGAPLCGIDSAIKYRVRRGRIDLSYATAVGPKQDQCLRDSLMRMHVQGNWQGVFRP